MSTLDAKDRAKSSSVMVRSASHTLRCIVGWLTEAIVDETHLVIRKEYVDDVNEILQVEVSDPICAGRPWYS